MTAKNILFSVVALAGVSAHAQDLNSEITVNHEIVPEERAATRMHFMPSVTLPSVKPGRLAAASNFAPGELTPYVYQLEAAPYASTLRKTPYKGYAVLGYGPIYNLAASAGYRFVDRDSLQAAAYLQFDGSSYKTRYPGLPVHYDGKVSLRRNTGLVGANTAWQSRAGRLTAELMYQFSDYNFPILDLQTLLTDGNHIRANVAHAGAGWGATASSIDYKVNATYDMVLFGSGLADNYKGTVAAGLAWHATAVSAWALDLGFSLDHSAPVGNKGVLHILPAYKLTTRRFTGSFGVDVDVCAGNVPTSRRVLVAPDLNLTWLPSAFFNMWLKMNGRIDDNYRGRLYDEQPYLLPGFDAGYSRIYNGTIGLTVGPWRGASLSLFGGFTTAYDWLMPAVQTGAMSPVDIKGFHGGLSAAYDYRRYLSLNVKAELAQSPDGDYTKGYALWRDHARFSLSCSATVRPIEPLEITVGYRLRTGRQKTLGNDRNLDLLAVNNLTAGVNYRITSRWSAFLRGDNLMNRKWYLGPSVPCQGITGMIGASYKF